MKCTATIRATKHIIPKVGDIGAEFTKISIVDCVLPEGHSGPHTPNPLLLLRPAMDLSDRSKGLWVLPDELWNGSDF